MVALILGCFYFFYVLIDYSAHTKVFHNEGVALFEIFLYYAFQFTKRAEMFLSVAVMIATIKVLTTSQMRLEILALSCGGIGFKKILRPFLWIALACSLLLYANIQFLQPYAVSKIDAFERHYFKKREKKHSFKPVNALILEDNSLLLYQDFDREKQAFFDVFWLKNREHLFRIKYLYPYEKKPLGKYVDSLMRTKEGAFVKLASDKEILFPEMHFESNTLFTAVHPPAMQSISQLAHRLGGKQTFYGVRKMSDREAEAATFFYYKVTLPLICLLAVIGPAPYCLRFSRQLPLFLIYASSLCLIVTFFTLIHSLVILGQSQVVPPLLAILAPQTLFF